MDKIFISGLKIKTIIGTKPKERKQKQFVIIDMEIASNISRAAATDNIADTLDYETLAMRIKKYVSNSQFYLVETLAEKIAQLALDEFNISWLRLRLAKIRVVSGTQLTGVEIERTRLRQVK